MIFEKATQQRVRFPSAKGELSTEDLWDLPLSSRDTFNLDSVAKAVNRELKAQEEDSFVSTRATPANTLAKLKLDVVKRVIEVKLEARSLAAARAEALTKKGRLVEILAAKADEQLRDLTPEELQKQIDALDV